MTLDADSNHFARTNGNANTDLTACTEHESVGDDAPTAVRVYIVRHGETEHNRLGIMQGHLDTALNDTGIAQARLAADALADVPFAAAYSSDLQRARKTAEIIIEEHPDVALQLSPALRERYMGDWQGGNIVDRGEPPANLEPLADLSARCLKWWNECVVRHAQRYGARARIGLGSPSSLEGDEETALEVDPELEPEHILVVSHGGLIGTLVKGLLGSRKVCAAEGVVVGRCFNASISVVELDARGRGVLVSYADTTHIDGELVQDNADVQP